VKGSFYGDLHATGKDGVRFFTENKVEVTRWLSEPGVPESSVERPTESGG
jgi:malonate-semialdehyde dehydrogenase (acetylating)/methylmalonate-semialdehyde dehydrogenase